MREDGASIRQCVALGEDAGCGGEGKEDRDGESESARERDAAYECLEDRLFEKEAGKNRHDCTSLFSLVYASALMEKENRVRAALWYYFGLAGESRLARDWIDPVRVIML